MPVIPIFLPQTECPYSCVFCDQARTVGEVQTLSTNEIRKTIDIALSSIESKQKPGKNQVAFYGGSFTLLEKSTQENYLTAVKPYLNDFRIHNIRISTRPDYIDNETLDLLEKYGVGMIELGVQTMDDKLLEKIGRGHSSRDVRHAVEKIRNYEFELSLQLMIGLPDETEESRISSWKKVLNLSPDSLRIHPTVVIKGTELEGIYRAGKYEPLSLGKSVQICTDMLIDSIKRKINVIRLGLQSSLSLQAEDVIIAGPWHPSFGQIVKGEVYYRMIETALRKLRVEKGPLEISVADKELNLVVGLKKRNLKLLSEKYPLIEFKTSVDNSLSRYTVKIDTRVNSIEINAEDI